MLLAGRAVKYAAAAYFTARPSDGSVGFGLQRRFDWFKLPTRRLSLSPNDAGLAYFLLGERWGTLGWFGAGALPSFLSIFSSCFGLLVGKRYNTLVLQNEGCVCRLISILLNSAALIIASSLGAQLGGDKTEKAGDKKQKAA